MNTSWRKPFQKLTKYYWDVIKDKTPWAVLVLLITLISRQTCIVYCGVNYNLCIGFAPWISREQMQKEAGILYKVLNCSKFLADARLLCSKAAVLGSSTVRQFILLLLVVLSPTLMTFWGFWHSVLPVHLCLRERPRVWHCMKCWFLQVWLYYTRMCCATSFIIPAAILILRTLWMRMEIWADVDLSWRHYGPDDLYL